MKIISGNSIDRKAWAAFVAQHPQGNIFQTPEMYDVYACAEHVTPITIAAMEGDKIVGILVAQYMTNGGALASWITARSIITGGPLAKDNKPEIVEALMREYRRLLPRKTIYSEIRPVYEMPLEIGNWMLEIGKWKRVGHYNLVMRVDKSEEELWNGMHKERRRNVGQAEKAGLRFEEVTEAAGRREEVALLQKTYERKHVPMADDSLFARLTEIMPEYVRFFAAYTEDKMIAGQIRLGYKDLLYAWYAGSDEDYFKLRPNDFTMWNVIRWAHEKGYKEFDFGGGGEPGKPYGVRDYKLKYGCEMYDYGRYVWAHRPVTYWAAAKAYMLYHRVKDEEDLTKNDTQKLKKSSLIAETEKISLSHKIKKLGYKDIDRVEWSRLVAASATGTWFQTPEAYEFYASMPELFRPFAVGLENDGKLRAVCVGYETIEKSAIKQFITRRAIIIGGPALMDNCSKEEVEVLMSTIRKYLQSRAIYIETRNTNDYSRWKEAFEKAGFSYEPHLNFHVHTDQGWEAIEENIGKHRKKYIRLSFRDGASIEENPTLEQVRAYYDILLVLYRTKVKMPLQPWEFFEKLYHCPSCKYLLVMFDGQVVGGSICMLLPGHGVYEWYACGKDGVFKNIHPSSVTKYAGMKYACDNGYAVFDMMGAGKPDEEYGVRDFKAEFGGELVEHGRFLCITKPLLYKIGVLGVKILKKIK